MKWFLLPVWLSLYVTGSDAAALQKKADLKPLLSDPARKWSPQTTVAFPGSNAFTDTTERWTIARPPTYSASISPGTEQDVTKIVSLATANKIPILATGGRHGYTSTLGDLHDGLAVDLSKLNSIKIDKAAKTLTVGPGVSVDAIMDPIYNAGFMLQTGTAYCPSVIGVTLGGGVGRFTGLFGLMIDDLLSVRIATANGKVVEASGSTNSDLFWAIRGAGANFGIITSATYRLHPLPNQGNIFTIDLIIPANMTSDYFKAVESFNGKMPAQLAGIAIATYDSTSNQAQILNNWIYVGSEADARKALAPILALNPPYNVASTVPFNKLINSTFPGFAATICQDNIIRDIYSANIKTYNAATMQTTFTKISDFFKQYPGGRNSALQYELYPNQAMASVSAGATAWPWRDATGYFQTSMTWNQGDSATQNAATALSKELRKDVAATSGYGDVTIFVNYAHGDEKIENIYGKDKLPRLAQLKKTWDPSNAFSFNNKVPAKYP